MRTRFILFFFCILFVACSTDDGSYTKPISLYEKVGGTWNLTRMRQVDEQAVAAGSGTTEMDLSEFFENFTLKLDENEDGTPSIFSASGAPALLPESGYWKLERAFQNWDGTPVRVFFYSDQACTQQTGVVSITAVPGSVPTMELTLTRRYNGAAFVSYVYTLIPVMQ